MQVKQLTVNLDDFNIVKLIQQELSITEEAAATFLFEIGLVSILKYPTNIERVDNVLCKHELLVNKIKNVYCI
jgi:hypothetical protein